MVCPCWTQASTYNPSRIRARRMGQPKGRLGVTLDGIGRELFEDGREVQVQHLERDAVEPRPRGEAQALEHVEDRVQAVRFVQREPDLLRQDHAVSAGQNVALPHVRIAVAADGDNCTGHSVSAQG